MKNHFEKYFDVLKDSIWLILYNIKPIFLFTLFFTIFNLLGAIVIVFFSFRLILFFSNIKYIGPDNIVDMILYIPNWVVYIMVAVLFSFLAIFQISGLTHAYMMSRLEKKTSFSGMLLASINASNKSLLPKNWLIVILILVVFPITGLTSISSAIYCLKIPEFIQDFIMANSLYSKLFIAMYIGFVIIEINLIFVFNFYTNENLNFIEACKKSLFLIKKHFWETFFCIIMMAILFFMFSTSISAILSDIISYFSNENSFFVKSNFSIDFQMLSKGFLYATFSPLFNLACVTKLFFKYLDEKAETKEIEKYIPNDKNIKLGKFVWFLIIVVVLIGLNFVLNIQYFSPKKETLFIPEVVAHRGDSIQAPENTMPAFKLAANENIRYIEFDVHQTKDNVIIVSHDDDLERVTGKKVFVHNLTYEEIQKLDTGKWFSPQYEGTKFTTLDETLKYLKNFDMTIQVEIKPSGFDNQLEENVVNIIKQNDLLDRCMITCLKLEPLLKIERIAPEVYTVYSMFVAWGDLSTISVDGYTIEEQNVNEELVKSIHKSGKKCFAWTVNTGKRVQYLVDCGVDGILTDNPIMMRNILTKCDYSGGIKEAIRKYIMYMVYGL